MHSASELVLCVVVVLYVVVVVTAAATAAVLAATQLVVERGRPQSEAQSVQVFLQFALPQFLIGCRELSQLVRTVQRQPTETYTMFHNYAPGSFPPSIN